MQERIILAPSCNGTELLRSLALFGQNTIGYRVVNAIGLSEIMLMHVGKSIEEILLTRKEEPAVYNSFITDIDYFKSASFADAENIANAIYSMRLLITEEDEEKIAEEKLESGEFKKKNEALVQVYKKYIETLKENKTIDTIGLIRKAIKEGEGFDAEFIVLKEYPISPLEEKLIAKVANNNQITKSLSELYGTKENQKNDFEYIEAYGASNEVEHVIGTIFENDLPLDQCIVACANTKKYAQLFYEYSQVYNIPVIFGSGVPITNANPAKLLKLYHEWDTKGFNGINALEALIKSDACEHAQLEDEIGLNGDYKKLNAVIKMAGSLRISPDNAPNEKRIKEYRELLEKNNDTKNLEILEAVEKLSKIFEKGVSSFIRNYSRVRTDFEGRIDRSAVNVICEAIDSYMRFSADGNINEIIDEILNKTVCSENSRAGSLFVTSISGALGTVRKNLFVTGLNADNFPGAPTENYLLLDSDYELFSKEKSPTSIKKVLNNKETLNNLIDTAKALDVKVRFSWSNFDLASLKEANPSSALFEVYQKENKDADMDSFKQVIQKAGFFDKSLSSTSAIGKAYSKGQQIEYTLEEKKLEYSYDADQAFSPSALEIYFQCPKRFLLTRLLGVKEPEVDDPFTVINANQVGTLAHSLMESLAENRVDKDEFMKKASDAFDEFLLSRPPMHLDAAQEEKKVFLDIMENAYEGDPDNEVVSAEEERDVEHESGIKLHGYPDRIEKTKDGKYIIADYKTGKIKHIEDDIDTCLQVIIYAYMAKMKAGIDISGCEYRYIREDAIVPCVYDENMEKALARKLEEVKKSLDNNDFPCTPPEKQEENCKYCTLADICGKDMLKAKDEGQEDD